MNNEQKATLAARLYKRRGEGVLVKRKTINIGGWQPVRGQCHYNVKTIVERDRRYKAVRGWVYADYSELGRATFFSHSIIETPEGELIDITPNPSPWHYPFIRHDGTEDDFADIVEGQSIVRLDHAIKDE